MSLMHIRKYATFGDAILMPYNELHSAPHPYTTIYYNKLKIMLEMLEMHQKKSLK